MKVTEVFKPQFGSPPIIDKGKLYYLASPFSHANPFVQNVRYEMINYIAAQLTLDGYMLIEPIGSCFDKSRKYELPGGYEYWKTRDRKLIEHSEGIIVAKMEGWSYSVGVTDEIVHAKELGLPVYMLDVNEFITPEVWNAIH
jgi:hypothetical protein